MEPDERAAIAADLGTYGVNASETMADFETAEQHVEPEVDGSIIVLPVELKTTVSAFLIGATQWRWTTHWEMLFLKTGPLAVPHTLPLGLDYAGLRHACAMAKLRLSAEDFAGVRLMEAHALKLLARR